MGHLCKIADKNFFAICDATNCCDQLYTFIEKLDETIPTFQVKNLIDGFSGALLEKSEILLDDKNAVMRKIKLGEVKRSLAITFVLNFIVC